jgi:hypothetical protein
MNETQAVDWGGRYRAGTTGCVRTACFSSRPADHRNHGSTATSARCASCLTRPGASQRRCRIGSSTLRVWRSNPSCSAGLRKSESQPSRTACNQCCTPRINCVDYATGPSQIRRSWYPNTVISATKGGTIGIAYPSFRLELFVRTMNDRIAPDYMKGRHAPGGWCLWTD